MHLMRANGRHRVETNDFCDAHGRSHLKEFNDRYFSTARIDSRSRPATEARVAFVFDFLIVDELQDYQLGYLGLIEAGGSRRLWMWIDFYATHFLQVQLLHYPSPRPRTHQAMTSAIESLGGQLKYVEIDGYYRERSMYEAKLHIRQLDTTVIVDVRPSDAIVLALISDVGIFVTYDVLAKLDDPN